MRSSLRWLLGATVLSTAWALWWPDEPGAATPEPRSVANVAPGAQQASAVPAREGIAVTLPERLAVQTLEPARADPFVGVQPPAPPAPKPVPVVTVVAPPAPPPAPMAPPLSYRYLGQMTDPSGAQRVYLAKADAAFVVGVGTQLEEGYVVQSLGPEGIRLHYPPLDAHAVIPVPPAPDSDRR